ncbi:uncharacterized protein LOC110625449 isoform X2 [Manihot esculenta]|uniref:uncharacterized protein LOC110625449 isoform X2 n=1 Tax=Manihot esculenta TaxID=3983 RepID=UPI000B5D5B61|nr:uncharacterized protein LOC110625449 isoform X2 [Manihot esculenta]
MTKKIVSLSIWRLSQWMVRRLGGIEFQLEEVKEVSEAADLCLVGRFLTERPINFHAMQHAMAALWCPTEKISVREVGGCVYVFKFFLFVDRDRALSMCPCTFNNYILLLEKMDGFHYPLDVPLNHLYLWVQIHGLPRGFNSEHVFKRLGDELGEFVESDEYNFKNLWNSYMRIRVRYNVNRPLCTETRLRKAGEEGSTVTFVYERAPTFCYIHGLFGHGERFCPKLIELAGQPVVRKYGSHLRANPRRDKFNIGSKWLRDDFNVQDSGRGSWQVPA